MNLTPTLRDSLHVLAVELGRALDLTFSPRVHNACAAWYIAVLELQAMRAQLEAAQIPHRDVETALNAVVAVAVAIHERTNDGATDMTRAELADAFDHKTPRLLLGFVVTKYRAL